jgi:hypothetical protein
VPDHDPAALSSALLARKGSAGAGGFAPMALDPNERQGWRFGRLGAWSSRSLRRGLGTSTVVAVALAVGAAAHWMSAPERRPGTEGPAPVAVAPVVPSPPGAAGRDRAGAEPEEIAGHRPDPVPAMAGGGDGRLALSGLLGPPPAPPPDPPGPALSVGLVPDAPIAVPPKPLAVEPLASTVPADKLPAAASTGRAPAKGRADGATTGYRIQLHTLGSRTAVDREWLRLRRRHADLLAGKHLVVDRYDGSGGAARYRLQLGHLANRSAAQQLCRALAERGQKCFVVPAT